MVFVATEETLHFTEMWEGAVDHWYLDIARVWTGMCGHVRLPGDLERYPENFSRLVIDAVLRQDITGPVLALDALMGGKPLPPGAVLAALDAAFNCGVGILRPPSSGFARALQADKLEEAGDHLLDWCHFRRDGIVYTNTGLLNRRKAERARLLELPHEPVTNGYEVCGAGAICNPDEIREIMARGAALWVGDQPDWGERPATD